MAGKTVEYQIAVNSTKGVTGVKQFSSAVKKELKSIEGDFEDTATAGQKVATVLSKMAGELDTELDRAAQAAEALSTVLGPDLAGRADVGSIVGDLQRMGLTFEEIVADADKLATSLKELDAVQLKGMDSGLGGVNTKMGTLERSAGSSRSVMANMVGNATQDLGALSGVAGSAGVAIGQMGEYMADALGEGEKLGSVIANFGKVAGPVAAISGALFVMEGVMKSIEQSKALEADRLKGYQTAVEGAVDDTAALADHLLEIGKIEFKDPTKGLFGGVGDLLPKLAALGISVQDFTKLIGGGEAGVQQFIDDLYEMRDAGEISTDTWIQLEAGLSQYQNTAEDAERIQRQLNEAFVVTDDLAKGAFFNWVNATDPAMTYGDQLLRIGQALDGAKGKLGEAFEFPPDVLRDMEIVAEALGIDLPAVYDLATQASDDYNTSLDETNTRMRETRDRVLELEQAAKETGIALGDALKPFEDGSAAVEAFGDAMEGVGRGTGLDWLDQLGDNKEALAGVFAVVKDNKGVIPDIFKTGTESSRDMRDALAELADVYEQDLLTVLEQSGGDFDKVRERAAVLRGELTQRFAAKFGLDLADEVDAAKVASMVDAVIPTDKEIELGIKLSKKDLLQLKADLAIEHLQGLLPATALQLKIDMAEGEIGPREALGTAQQILDENGIEVDLGVQTRKANDDLVAFADQERSVLLGVEPTGLENTAATIDAGPGGKGWPPIPVKVVPWWDQVQNFFGFGPVATGLSAPPAPGGLAVAPMALGAAPTAVGPAAHTMAPAVAGARQQVTQNIIVQAAVIGDPMAVTEAIEAGVRRGNRLNPVYQ